MSAGHTLSELGDSFVRMRSAGRKLAAVVAHPRATNVLHAENLANGLGDVRLKRGGYTLFGCDVTLDLACEGIVLLDADEALAYEAAAEAAAGPDGARLNTPEFFRARSAA